MIPTHRFPYHSPVRSTPRTLAVYGPNPDGALSFGIGLRPLPSTAQSLMGGGRTGSGPGCESAGELADDLLDADVDRLPDEIGQILVGVAHHHDGNVGGDQPAEPGGELEDVPTFVEPRWRPCDFRLRSCRVWAGRRGAADRRTATR